VQEQGPTPESTPLAREVVESKLPASLATKHGLASALEEVIPDPTEMPEEPQRLSFDFAEEGWLTVERTGENAEWAIDVLPTRLTYGGFVVGSGGETTPVEEVRTSYDVRVISEDEIAFKKEYWPQKSDEEEAVDATETEAKVLLTKLASLQGRRYVEGGLYKNSSRRSQ
jgi:hypothetical protein